MHDPRINYLWKANGERAAARNAGVQVSRGTYVTFLDSDDWLYPRHLGLVREAIQRLNDPVVYHQAYEVVDEGGRILSRDDVGKRNINKLLLTRGNVLSCMGVFVKRDIARTNPFNETLALTGLEDWELWIRLAAQYPILHGVDVTSALVHHEDRSVWQIPDQKLLERVNTFLDIVCGNAMVTAAFDALLPQLRANSSTYISLHLSELQGHKGQALAYFFRGLSYSWRAMFRRRTLAILRNLLLR
jgi:glycosyltransferase involved in cell wall biosynthesis